MGTLESWVKDGSFLSLPFGLSLVLEVGRPVGQQQPLSVMRPWPCVKSLLPPSPLHCLFLAFPLSETLYFLQDGGHGT